MKETHKKHFFAAMGILFCGLHLLSDTIPVPLWGFLMGALTGLGALLLMRSLSPGEALNKLRVWKHRG
jgi:hypothetical protein